MSFFEFLEQIDRSVFLTVNSWHSKGLDHIMTLISGKLIWIPAYAYLLFLIQKKSGWKKLGFAAISITLLIFLTDTGSVHLFKNVFLRYRPCHNEEIKHLVHVVGNHCGGQYGFISSHAANFFGIATFVWLLLHDYYKRIGIWLYLAASIVALSRVYLGVHYPSDVAVGALWGITCAMIAFVVYRILITKFDQKKTV